MSRGSAMKAIVVFMVCAVPLAGCEAAGQSAGEIAPVPAAAPHAGERRTVDLGEGVSLELVWIPPGEFLMGSPEDEEDRYADEGPQHRVRISRGFWMGKYEVTQAQWESVMGGNPSYITGDPMRPVERVMWEDCQAFLRKLNRRAGGSGFRLPTEAEWEYACRAGTTTGFSFGDDYSRLRKYAWYYANSDVTTYPVGGKKPNAWGLYDMHGNVWEWCEADWHDGYRGAPTDGSAWVDAPRGLDRVFRGGGWNFDPGGSRSAFRFRFTPGFRFYDLGFRVVLPAVQ